jgi:hypothetical protein
MSTSQRVDDAVLLAGSSWPDRPHTGLSPSLVGFSADQLQDVASQLFLQFGQSRFIEFGSRLKRGCLGQLASFHYIHQPIHDRIQVFFFECFGRVGVGE